MPKKKGWKKSLEINMAREPSYDSYPDKGCKYFPFPCAVERVEPGVNKFGCPHPECINGEQVEFKQWWAPLVIITLYIRGLGIDDIAERVNWHRSKVIDQLERIYGKELE